MQKKVIITGCNGGIGQGIAKLFKDNNWSIIGIDIKENNLKNIDYFKQLDVSKEESWIHVAEYLEKNDLSIDSLINSAGIQICKSLSQTSSDEWDQIMNTNLKSQFYSLKYILPQISNNGGSIINISSIHAVVSSNNIGAYAVSKGAICSLTRAAAIEYAHLGIRINSILPGAIETDMLRSGMSRLSDVSGLDEKMTRLSIKHLTKCIGKPEDVAQLSLFLADSSKSSFITGQSYIIDGGVSIQLFSES